MVDHIRKQIRDAVKTALTGLTTTGANVFSGRVSPLKESEVPGLLIFLNGDDATEDMLAKARKRRLRIVESPGRQLANRPKMDGQFLSLHSGPRNRPGISP